MASTGLLSIVPVNADLGPPQSLPTVQTNSPWYSCVYQEVSFEAEVNNWDGTPPYTWVWYFDHWSGCGEDFELSDFEPTQTAQHSFDYPFDCACEYRVYVSCTNGDEITVWSVVPAVANLHITPCTPDVHGTGILCDSLPLARGSPEWFFADLYNSEIYPVWVDLIWYFDGLQNEFARQTGVFVPSRVEISTDNVLKRHWPQDYEWHTITVQIWFFGYMLDEFEEEFRALI